MEIALLLKMEFWRVNFWRLLASPPNPPKYSPTKILRYTVIEYRVLYSKAMNLLATKQRIF